MDDVELNQLYMILYRKYPRTVTGVYHYLYLSRMAKFSPYKPYFYWYTGLICLSMAYYSFHRWMFYLAIKYLIIVQIEPVQLETIQLIMDSKTTWVSDLILMYRKWVGIFLGVSRCRQIASMLILRINSIWNILNFSLEVLT